MVMTIFRRCRREALQFVTYDPFPGGVNLTNPSLLFAISYMTGMLVRYYPRQCSHSCIAKRVTARTHRSAALRG